MVTPPHKFVEYVIEAEAREVLSHRLNSLLSTQSTILSERGKDQTSR